MILEDHPSIKNFIKQSTRDNVGTKDYWVGTNKKEFTRDYETIRQASLQYFSLKARLTHTTEFFLNSVLNKLFFGV